MLDNSTLVKLEANIQIYDRTNFLMRECFNVSENHIESTEEKVTR